MSIDIPRGTLVRSRVGVAGALEAALERELTGYARIEPDSLRAEGELGVLTFEDGVPVTAYCERGDSHGTKRGDSHGTKRGGSGRADTHATDRDDRGVDVDENRRFSSANRTQSDDVDESRRLSSANQNPEGSGDVAESRSDSSGSEGHGPSGREGQSPSGNRASPGDNRKRPVSGDSQNALRSGEALATLAGPGPCSVELYELPADALEQVHEAPEFTVPPGAPAEELAGEQALAERIRERAPDDAPEQAGAGALESFLQNEDRIAAIQEEARAEAEKRAEEWGLDGELASE